MTIIQPSLSEIANTEVANIPQLFERYENYYDFFDVQSNASYDTLKVLIRRTQLKYHPDQAFRRFKADHPHLSAEEYITARERLEEFAKKVIEICNVLSNPETRQVYDDSLNPTFTLIPSTNPDILMLEAGDEDITLQKPGAEYAYRPSVYERLENILIGGELPLEVFEIILLNCTGRSLRALATSSKDMKLVIDSYVYDLRHLFISNSLKAGFYYDEKINPSQPDYEQRAYYLNKRREACDAVIAKFNPATHVPLEFIHLIIDLSKYVLFEKIYANFAFKDYCDRLLTDLSSGTFSRCKMILRILPIIRIATIEQDHSLLESALIAINFVNNFGKTMKRSYFEAYPESYATGFIVNIIFRDALLTAQQKKEKSLKEAQARSPDGIIAIEDQEVRMKLEQEARKKSDMNLIYRFIANGYDLHRALAEAAAALENNDDSWLDTLVQRSGFNTSLPNTLIYDMLNLKIPTNLRVKSTPDPSVLPLLINKGWNLNAYTHVEVFTTIKRILIGQYQKLWIDTLFLHTNYLKYLVGNLTNKNPIRPPMAVRLMAYGAKPTSVLKHPVDVIFKEIRNQIRMNGTSFDTNDISSLYLFCIYPYPDQRTKFFTVYQQNYLRYTSELERFIIGNLIALSHTQYLTNAWHAALKDAEFYTLPDNETTKLRVLQRICSNFNKIGNLIMVHYLINNYNVYPLDDDDIEPSVQPQQIQMPTAEPVTQSQPSNEMVEPVSKKRKLASSLDDVEFNPFGFNEQEKQFLNSDDEELLLPTYSEVLELNDNVTSTSSTSSQSSTWYRETSNTFNLSEAGAITFYRGNGNLQQQNSDSSAEFKLNRTDRDLGLN